MESKEILTVEKAEKTTPRGQNIENTSGNPAWNTYQKLFTSGKDRAAAFRSYVDLWRKAEDLARITGAKDHYECLGLLVEAYLTGQDTGQVVDLAAAGFTKEQITQTIERQAVQAAWRLTASTPGPDPAKPARTRRGVATEKEREKQRSDKQEAWEGDKQNARRWAIKWATS